MKCMPARYTVALLTSLGLALLYGLRININLTIVSMVNYTGVDYRTGGVCGNTKGKENKAERGEFHWPNDLQGIILSSFYWGYLLVMMPSAILCQQTSVKWVWFGAMLLNIIPCLLIPVTSTVHYSLIIVMRTLQGFGAGAAIPATSLILARWVPISERNTIGSLVFSGSTAGMVISILIIGVIDIHLGWRAVFYIMGSVCVPWLFAWALLIGDSPEKAKYISKEEVELILTSHGDKADQRKKVIVLWKNIFTSKPFWALVVTHCCANWVSYLLITDLPIYMDKVFEFAIDDITKYIAIGGGLNWAFSIALGRTLDYMRKKKNLSQTWAKKTSTLITYVPMGCMMVGMAYVKCNWILGVIISILTFMLMGGSFSGFLTNHVDIGPKIAATLMGLTNTAGTVSGIVVPIFVGKILGDGRDIVSWFIIFWVGAGFILLLLLTYTIFGSGELQNYYIEVDMP